MRMAIIGYGGVGSAFIRLLNDKKSNLVHEGIDIVVHYIINSSGGIYDPAGINYLDVIEFSKTKRDLTKYPKGGSKDVTFDKMLERKDVDIVVEMTPTNKKTGEPGMTHITKALENGIHVVTANKGPILLNFRKLNELAAQNKVQLCIGCTTGGALPAINGGIMDLAGADILSIEGVLNGTTNFILKEMDDQGSTYKEALKKAQDLGIAETDPTLDVEGWDTAAKLLILTNVLMNEEKTLEDITVEGITNITPQDIQQAKAEKKKYKLIGKTINEDQILKMTVKLEKLEDTHPLYGVEGKNKAVRYTSDTLGDLTIIGGASGVMPAAASILRDVINIHRGYKFSKFR
ncbi:homoserine dehydrogenase [Clostridiaceae bacterium 35-E11]